MRILITGGSGFVCLNIAQTLLMEGNDVFIYDKASLPSLAQQEFVRLPGTLSCILGDIQNPILLEQTLCKYQITHIIHGAAITPAPEQEKDTLLPVIQINFMGTMNVLECIKKHPDIKLIYISSMAACGRALSGTEGIVESRLSFCPVSGYGIAKYASEQMILEYSRCFSFSAVTVRLGAVFGPWEQPGESRSLMSPALRILKALHRKREVLFNRFSCEEWIYVRDVANYVWELLNKENYGFSSYCLVSGFSWSTQIWCDLILADLPGRSYRLCQAGETPDICFSKDTDNATILLPNIWKELSYRPLYGPKEAYDDYAKWLRSHGELHSL